MKQVETRTAVYVVRDDGIIVQTVKAGMRQDLAEARENMAMYLELAGGDKRLLLVDLRHAGPTGAGVREFYAEHSPKLKANAMLIGNALSEMIGNFFIKLNKPDAPTKLFTVEPAAVAWLRAFDARST